MEQDNSKGFRFSLIYILIAVTAVWLFSSLILRPIDLQAREVSYNTFRTQVEAGEIEHVRLGQDRIFFTPVQPEADEPEDTEYNTVRVEDPDLVEDLLAAGVSFEGESADGGMFSTILVWLIPLIPVALIWWFMMRRMREQVGGGQGGGGLMSFGKSKAQQITSERTKTRFRDVGGLGEVEVELREVIDFLTMPTRFTRLGAELPKGILLVGPPGTGKTLLARATAGEAKVPFFMISGSHFVEMFVGVGASRVRDLFAQAKAKAPCIVFVDELDALGQSRGAGTGFGSNEEREQTLNQLLSEMDGFEPNAGVVIMAATNRPDVLDKALLRAGRFDRQIQVPLPTESGRLEILKIHTRDVKLADGADLERLAKITSGFSGADLANIINEAALVAVRRDKEAVDTADFDYSIERVMAGLQRHVPMSDDVKHKVALHETGHALVAAILPGSDPIHKVSIIPTSKGALGYTMQIPNEDQFLISESELRNRMAVMMGGRAAELIVVGEPSTGAANDLQQATEIARRMVAEFGMTKALGPIRYLGQEGQNYLGVQIPLRPELGEQTAREIDQEIRRLVEEAQAKAIETLEMHIDELHEITEILKEEEVIDGERVMRILEEREPVEQQAIE